ncbi:MAG: 50S ribosomal protein L5 [Candidatus Xenolissoclinum pacificiensis L6]|uniref:50S ribosomal protein L5 n=1 Tax=Candidatus Xenolissoclinum pacificiensis L6 TaxID=1401685 RepID=W2V1K3_9RICK|nr:MAG: 50S ribosomal protein L5 [Candidatus Xenolissoclinum pacificiensis L6]
MIKDFIFSEKVDKVLRSELDYVSGSMLIPRIKKISINVSLGSQVIKDSKCLDYAQRSLSMIVGQKAVICRAKKSIASFKLRKGYPVACKVTLRRKVLIDAFFKKTLIGLARQRDFSPFSAEQFDGSGNFSFGVLEHAVYDEVDYESMYLNYGMNINIITNLNDSHKSMLFLKVLGIPFK